MDAINERFRNFQNVVSNCQEEFFSPLSHRVQYAHHEFTDILNSIKQLSGLLPPQKLQEMQAMSAKLTCVLEAFEQHLTAEKMDKLRAVQDKLLENFPEDVKTLSASQIEMFLNTIETFSEMVAERDRTLRELKAANDLARSVFADMHKFVNGMRVDGAELPDNLLDKLNDLTVSGDKIDEGLTGLKLNE